jgi:class 3 adenylate cyclase/tetratricopeptide (TPR) repeat protein
MNDLGAAESDRCAACGAANPEGSRFCGSCGAGLGTSQPCPACGRQNPAGQRFCNGCGASLAADPEESPPQSSSAATPPDGERKQVTVLFADVKGSMDLAERVDAEEWREIMQRFFSLLSEGVQRFEGTVDKFTGDGIMALFGAPIAHEDHASRACFAALQIEQLVSEYAAELRRSKSLSFSVRIGINSGEVVAGGIGEDDRPSYTAVGHTVGLAQRMEALAEPGTAYLTEHAAKLARGYLELKDLGEFDVKGASKPIGVFELVGVGAARSRLDLSRERGLSRFVGRADEMAVLEDALENAGRGSGAVIGIVAEAGVGKSRLCHELAEYARNRGIEVYEAQAQAHGQAIPFMPVLQMLRNYFGIEDRDADRVAREKIAGRLLLLDQGFAGDLPLVFDFLAVPDPERPPPQISAEARQRALRGVIRRLYGAPGRKETVVSLVEDLHWMDEGSAEFLGEMVAAVEGTPTLAVLNFRPEYQAEWMSSSRVYHRMSLSSLGPDSTAELIAALAGDDPSLDGLGELIHERTGGNPFFIEEVVRELVETGALEGEHGAYRLVGSVEDTGVPPTVQVILAARIDRLEPASKALLQSASVVGKEVAEPALARVTGFDDETLQASLKELIAGGFLYEREIYPERILAFSHPLTVEVAYGSQLAEQRAAAHAATAQAMIELNPERHDELSALIAQHLEQGGETLEAARWSARAAHWAGYSQPQDALRLWRRVSGLADQLPETEETQALRVSSRLLQLDYGWRLGTEPEEADALMSEAREIAVRTDDRGSLAMLVMLGSARPGLDHRADDWTAAAAEAVGLADDSGDGALRVAIRTAGSYSFLCAGRFDEVERLLDRANEIAGDDPTVGAGVIIGCPYAFSLMTRGTIRRDAGDFDQAEELFKSALRVAAEHGDPETESWTRGNLATLAVYRGDPDAALALAQRNYELTEQLGDVFSRHFALFNLGFARLEAGDAEGALDAVERADKLYRDAMGNGGEAEVWRRQLRAEALLATGRGPEALDEAKRAVEVGRERGMHWGLARALRTLATVKAGLGEPGAEETLDQASALAEQIGMSVEAGLIEEQRRSVKPAEAG